MSSLRAPFQPHSPRCFVLLPLALEEFCRRKHWRRMTWWPSEYMDPVDSWRKFHCSELERSLWRFANSWLAKGRSVSLATSLNPTYTAAYLSMSMDQLIWSPGSIEDDEKDMMRLNTFDVMRDAMKSEKRFISQAQQGSPSDSRRWPWSCTSFWVPLSIARRVLFLSRILTEQ